MLLHFMERREIYEKMIRYEKAKKEIDEVDIN